MLEELARCRVRVIDRATYEEVTPGGILIRDGRTGERELVEADTIVTATGYETDDGLADRYGGCAKRIIVVGDAREVADIGSAVLAGWEAANAGIDGLTRS
jgi:hypothetical protein